MKICAGPIARMPITVTATGYRRRHQSTSEATIPMPSTTQLLVIQPSRPPAPAAWATIVSRLKPMYIRSRKRGACRRNQAYHRPDLVNHRRNHRIRSA